MARRILVTGGSGFIGTNLVAHHLQAGDDVCSVDIAEPRNPSHRALWRRIDLRQGDAIVQAVEEIQPEVVYHMAARTDLLGGSVAAYESNTVAVSNLIDALLRATQLRLVVFASSMLVCRMGYVPANELDYSPTTAYGESKVIGERLVRGQAGSLPWVMVRPTSIWGPWFGTPYRDFFDMVRRGLYVHPAGSRVRRSYGYVGNAVYQLTRLADVNAGSLLGRTVYLADFEPIEIKGWATMIAREFGSAPVRELPMPLFRVAARIGDLAGRAGVSNPPMTTFRLRNMLTEMVHDTTALAAEVGTLPFSTEQGVQLTCEWLRRPG